MSSIFTKIIKGNIPCYKIAENRTCIAFLDINPNTEGHTLCVPKKEIDKIFDLSNSDYLDLLSFSRKVALALREVVPCKRIGMSVIGLEVPHVHVHLIPLKKMEDATFYKKKSLTNEQYEELAFKISKKYKEN